MGQLMNEGEKAPPASLLHRVDDDNGIQGMREAKAASVSVWKTIVKNEDPFLFDPFAADHVELARILRVSLVLKFDVEKVAGFERKLIYIGVAGGGERRKLESASEVSAVGGLAYMSPL